MQSGASGTSLGYMTTVVADNGIAIGGSANAVAANSVAIGSNVKSTSANEFRLGNANHTLYATKALSTGSDERDKIDFAAIKNGLDFINKVEPIQYVRNLRENYIETESLSEEEKELFDKYGLTKNSYNREEYEKGTKKGDRKRVGVKAKQVQEALEEVYGTADYADIVMDNLFDRRLTEEIPEIVENQLSVSYSNFIPFLISAIQELDKKNERL